MPAITRIYFVGAMAGVEAVWRKFVNTIALDVYKVDVAIVVGDTGAGSEDRTAAWKALATERLTDSEIPLHVLDGEAHGRVVQLPGGRQLLALSAGSAASAASDPPSQTDLDELVAQLDDPRRAVFALPATPPRQADLIERHKPMLAVCGGDQAEKWWIGDTLCLAPGSQAGRGGLCGYVVDVGHGGVMVAQPIRT